MRRRVALVGAVVAALAATNCAPDGPRAVVAGEDGCAYCRMTISDLRFGGEAITSTGRPQTFDAIECLVSWARTAPIADRARIYVMDMNHPGTLVAAERAGFLIATRANSPMGRAVSSFASNRAADSARSKLGGRVATWKDILADSTIGVGRP